MYPSNRVPYLWASYGGDSIVSESAVAPLFSNSIYTANPPKNITLKRYFFYPRSEDAKAFIQKISKWAKSLAIVFSMISQCNNIIKQIRESTTYSASQFPTVLHNASLFFHGFYSEYQRNVTISASTLDRRRLRTSRTQKTNWIG